MLEQNRVWELLISYSCYVRSVTMHLASVGMGNNDSPVLVCLPARGFTRQLGCVNQSHHTCAQKCALGRKQTLGRKTLKLIGNLNACL